MIGGEQNRLPWFSHILRGDRGHVDLSSAAGSRPFLQPGGFDVHTIPGRILHGLKEKSSVKTPYRIGKRVRVIAPIKLVESYPFRYSIVLAVRSFARP